MQRIKDLDLKIILPILLFAAFMTWFLFRVSASTPFASLEPESASLSSGTTIASDSSATGGSFIQFGTASTGGGGGTGNPWDGAGVKSFPCSGVTINVGDNWQNKVNANPSGTTFCIKKGTHRLQQVVPKANDTFIGEPGAIMSGAKLLTGWSQSGSDWVVGGQTQGPNELRGACSGNDMCKYPEDVWIGGKLLAQVSSRSALASGKFYFDYGADKIYIRDNPSGKVIKTSVTDYAFVSGVTGVHIKGLVVEKYATPQQRGTIGTVGANGWVVEYNEIRDNHGCGVKLAGSNSRLLHNYIHHQGQLGVCGGGSDQLVKGNVISYNATPEVGVSTGFGSGTKWVQSRNLTVRGNWVHHNYINGLWTDGNNVYVTYEDNLVEDNYKNGIFHEISYDAVIRNNKILHNGFKRSSWNNGSGILINASPNVEIYGNYLEGNKNGISLLSYDRGGGPGDPDFGGCCGPWIVTNNYIHNNTIKMAVNNSYTGMIGPNGDYDVNSVRFRDNTYYLKGGTDYFKWNSSETSFLNKSEWQALGQDKNSTFNVY